MKHVAFVLFGVAVAHVVGCGRGQDRLETVSVNGRLLIDDEPFGPALLNFTPAGGEGERPVVNGYVQEDGTFVLTTYEQGDGAPPGTYNVVLTADPLRAGMMPNVGPATVEIAKSNGGAQQLEVSLESTGQMRSPLPPPGQEGLGGPGRLGP